ncbi:MAG: amidohydrolase family protein [Candidatus Aminicenantes bacterium]|nr:amidohydrolase family protein [Candidatus Aminicenantes bacterium]NIM82435.1 amidohydrolase family protein [Candidatus Aminicenantes bacterium]NIN21796.1 amidohydrolase family protein [Candidatus Aminicenantes bacterium]NIN45588.1 amidohydrolase family protein [Candidatus Aminicenantes bacterium]NIN88419.1 amidohydrolase family protein [Candidatus Aminicenantes bacterium]
MNIKGALSAVFIVILCYGLWASGPIKAKPADLILKNGEVYTMEPDHPWAAAVVITANKITVVLDKNKPIKPYIGPKTRVIDLKGKFVVPGFIDGHVHFNQAGALINDANLLKVADDQGLKKELQRVVEILDDGEWITGGLWGAYEQWAPGADKAGKKKKKKWLPNRWTIDDITKNNPCLLNNFNRKLYLANTAALKAAGLENTVLPGMHPDKNNRPTGLIYRDSPALEKIRKVIKKKSLQRLMNENRAALKRLAECGIVELHDIAKPDQTARFIQLQENGELTCRVWLRPDLSRAEEMKKKGFKPGLHPKTKTPDRWLRYGALKGYIDGIMGTHGALFFKPYDDQPGNYGHYRRHTSDDPDYKTPNMEKMYRLIKIGYSAGFVSNVHAIGTKGVALMLDTYERLSKDLGKSLEGFRVIHAQVIRPEDFPRFKNLNVIAEVNPYHVSDDMRWMEERIGHERCKGAYAFKSMLDNGAILSFGSDWPGTSAAEYHVHPKYLIHAAVNRTTVKGTPKGGWFPEQKISVHEALKAYTINNAYAAFEDDIRGSIEKGKLADITVCDRNLLKIDPNDILKMNVEMTIVDGKIVFERNSK